MSGRWLASLVAVGLASSCGGGQDDLQGTWRFVSLEVGGEAIEVDSPLFMDVTLDEFRAATTCNWQSGEFGGEILTTLVGCSGTAHEVESHMRQAFHTKPVERDGRLIFDDGELQLVYERFEVPRPPELFAVLGDPTVDVDESALPPEAVTGSVPPDYAALIPVASPSAEIDLFLGQLADNICVVYATAAAMDTSCTEPRFAATQAVATRIPITGQPLLRVALIPDRFVAAAAKRPELGIIETNMLIVSDDATAGRHTLVDDTGAELDVVISPS